MDDIEQLSWRSLPCSLVGSGAPRLRHAQPTSWTLDAVAPQIVALRKRRVASVRIGFAGASGLMGHGMAKNFLLKGFPVTILIRGANRAPVEDLLALGAKGAKTAAEVASSSDVVILCVTGGPEVESCVFGPHGIMASARPGLIVVDTSTSEVSTTTKTREALDAVGVKFVDAPLARTPIEAEKGKLNTMVGADDATFAALQPVFAAYCENIVHAGPPGHGLVLKLVNNFIAQSICTATAEGFCVAAKFGLDLKKLHALVSAGAVNSGLFQMMAGKMLEGPGPDQLGGLKFTLVNAAKDLRYYTHLTESLMLPATVGEAVHQSLVTANALGFGDKFVPSLFEAQEKLTGTAIVPRS